METLSGIKLRIMIRAFQIRLNKGEKFEEIAKDYPKLNDNDFETIKNHLK